MNGSGMEWLAESARCWTAVQQEFPGVTVSAIVGALVAVRWPHGTRGAGQEGADEQEPTKIIVQLYALEDKDVCLVLDEIGSCFGIDATGRLQVADLDRETHFLVSGPSFHVAFGPEHVKRLSENRIYLNGEV